MSDPEDVRRLALALPEAAEHTHFRLPAFRVAPADVPATGSRRW